LFDRLRNYDNCELTLIYKLRKIMKNLQSMFYTLVMLLGLTSASNAASMNGIYLEVGSSAAGVAIDGSATDTGSNSTTVGSVGKTAVIANYGLGYMTDRSNKMGLDLGYLITPGEAKISRTSDGTGSDVTFEISDTTEYYLAPMINISEDASLYLKFGWNSSDVKTTGDVTKISSMDGETVALGTVMSWGTNLYIRSEAGMTEYDTITGKGLGNTIGTDEVVTASPEVYYGKIAIGYKF
jgi:hypothetical protein